MEARKKKGGKSLLIHVDFKDKEDILLKVNVLDK